MSNNIKLRILSISIGLIFFYFGFLKLVPNASPAESLGINTVGMLCLGLFSKKTCIVLLALLEVSIGLSLLTGKFLKWGVLIGIGHLIFTFTPILFFPDQVFSGSAWTPSLLGQYIYKNIALISALWVLYPSARSGIQTETSNSNLINLTSQ